jgi:hypothetical protein
MKTKGKGKGLLKKMTDKKIKDSSKKTKTYGKRKY